MAVAKKNKRGFLSGKKYMLLSGLVLIVLVVGGLLFYRSHKAKLPPAVLVGPASPSIPSSNPKSTKSSGSGAAASAGATASSNAKPIAPSGVFISNHKPNLGGSPAPNTEQSYCTTGAGADCTIEFTMNGVTKSLPTKTADGSGSVSWNWTLQQVGLTAGSWEVTAVASLNNQTVSTKDQLPLQVSP